MYENVDLQDMQKVPTENQANTTQTQSASEPLPVELNVAYHSVQPPPSVEAPYYEKV